LFFVLIFEIIKLYFEIQKSVLMTCKWHFPNWQCHIGKIMSHVRFWRRKWR